MAKVAVYGSLRVGEYNYDRFKESFGDEIKVVQKEITVPGFNLYSLGPYPAIQRGENNLVVDILEVNGQALRSMDSMELGAGYQIESVNVPEIQEDARIYVFPRNRSLGTPIESGNWSEYLKNN